MNAVWPARSGTEVVGLESSPPAASALMFKEIKMQQGRVLDLIEESAARPHEQGGQDYHTTLLCSVAISAKRIADSLDQIVATLDQVSDGNSYAAINTRSTT